MNINEQIAKLEEKISKKQLVLEKKRKSLEDLKNEVKALEKGIEGYREKIERLRFKEITELMQTKSITAEAIKQAIISGSLKPSAVESEGEDFQLQTNKGEDEV